MRFAEMLPFGGEVLEVAPGDGSLAIQLAKTGRLRVAALNLTPASVDAGRRNAEKQRVRVDFNHGKPERMPFPDSSFDFLVCRHAFRKFAEPVAVLREMHRVLKPGRKGVIIDLRRDVPFSEIRKHVKSLRQPEPAGFLTLLRLALIDTRGAYSRPQFEAMLRQVPFGTTRIDVTPVGVEVWFER